MSESYMSTGDIWFGWRNPTTLERSDLILADMEEMMAKAKKPRRPALYRKLTQHGMTKKQALRIANKRPK